MELIPPKPRTAPSTFRKKLADRFMQLKETMNRRPSDIFTKGHE